MKSPHQHSGIFVGGEPPCLALLGPLPYAGKSVLVKPNFNTADPAPGSTHNDTLEQLLIELKAVKPLSIAVGERSGPPLTESVLKQKGVIELCDRLGVKVFTAALWSDVHKTEWVRRG